MKIPFYKYQGAGNDFVIIDQYHEKWLAESDRQLIAQICDRRFGIGSDGLMWIEPSGQSDFKMVYFNSDGGQSSMCGNGGRCIAHLARQLGYCSDHTSFDAIDGLHEAKFVDEDIVSLKMNDVSQIEKMQAALVLDTGSPHYVEFVSDINEVDMVGHGQKVRYSPEYEEEGINVNCVQRVGDVLHIRTYERGVENETLACGTGVTAAVLANAYLGDTDGSKIQEVQARGGKLSVSFVKTGDSFSEIWLTGPATFVFQGSIEV